MDKIENELIAEFMGFEVLPFENSGGAGFVVTLNGQPKKWGGNFSVAIYGTLEHNIDKCLNMYGGPKYDTSFDWIMPVVDKINYVRNYTSHGEEERFIYNALCTYLVGVDIIMAYAKVVQYIKWYNAQPK